MEIKMKIKKGYVLKEVASEYIVVPVGMEAINFNGMLTLNKSAKRLFEALKDDVELDDLVNVLTSQYEITREEALNDIHDFIKILESKKMLE